MFARMLVLVAIVIQCGACVGESGSSQNTAPKEVRGEDDFVNPVFACPSGNVVEPGEGYPHPLQQFPITEQPERSVAQLQDFCARMQERFSGVEMSVAEAQRVYEAIPQVLNIRDESFGMPSPEDAPIPEVDLTARVMLRKVSEERYELFYYTIGCGRTYSLYEIELKASGALVREIEIWSESSDC